MLLLLTFVGNDGLFLFQASSGVEFEEDDVTIFHHIFLALLPVATSSAYTGFRSVLLIIGEFHDFRHDETLFEVRVNFAGIRKSHDAHLLRWHFISQSYSFLLLMLTT